MEKMANQEKFRKIGKLLLLEQNFMSFSIVNLVLLQYPIPNLFWTCTSFFSSFGLTVFIKIFLIQKSKSSTNLNHKEGKQEKATID